MDGMYAFGIFVEFSFIVSTVYKVMVVALQYERETDASFPLH